MSIEKFASPEEAQQALMNRKPDSAYFERLLGLYDLWDSLLPRTYPRGVFKYRTIEEADEQSQEWLLENALRVRRRRRCL